MEFNLDPKELTDLKPFNPKEWELVWVCPNCHWHNTCDFNAVSDKCKNPYLEADGEPCKYFEKNEWKCPKCDAKNFARLLDCQDRCEKIHDGKPCHYVQKFTKCDENHYEQKKETKVKSINEVASKIKPGPATLLPKIETTGPAYKFYLAGKITQHGWRDSIVKGFKTVHGRTEIWKTLEKSIYGKHHYVGPYFQTPQDHCDWFHGDSAHGVGSNTFNADAFDHSYDPAQDVVLKCLAAIDQCDVFFFYASDTAYGSLVELGYAVSRNKFIVCASGFESIKSYKPKVGYIGDNQICKELWFAFKLADIFIHDTNPELAFKKALNILEHHESARLKAAI